MTVASPLSTSSLEWTLARSFDVARASRARVASVGGDDAWESAFAREAARHDGVAAERMSVKAAVHDLAFEPERFDVVVTPEPYAEALLGFVAHGGTPRVAASSRVAGSGPSVFAPAHGAAQDIAGQGVANPASMLLAAALMLGEGLGERRAAETLDQRGAGRSMPTDRRSQTPRPRSLFGVGAHHDGSSPVSSIWQLRNVSDARSNARVLSRGVRMEMNGADAILRSLEAEGVEVAFGLPGGAILPLYDAFARGTTVRHVLARHEQGAGHMAEGYARASGRAGVAIATSGPGATNLVTPIADAWMDSTPLVCITGQVRSHLIGTDAFQECDITGITIPIVKHSWLVQDVEELPHVLKAAFHVAQHRACGPVLVDMPRDIQEAAARFRVPRSVDLPGWKPPRRANRARSHGPPRRSPPPRGRCSMSAAAR